MNVYSLIAIGILLVGLLICFFLIQNGKRKARAIKHYEYIRDKLTLKEKEEPEEDEDDNVAEKAMGGFGLGDIIGGFIVILVGVNLIPIVAKQIMQSSQGSNLTSSQNQVLNLIPIFFAVGILVASVGIVATNLKKSGLL